MVFESGAKYNMDPQCFTYTVICFRPGLVSVPNFYVFLRKMWQNGCRISPLLAQGDQTVNLPSASHRLAASFNLPSTPWEDLEERESHCTSCVCQILTIAINEQTNATISKSILAQCHFSHLSNSIGNSASVKLISAKLWFAFLKYRK